MVTQKIFLNKEFDRIWQKIKNMENIVFLRFGDGERSIMLGKPVTAQEGWVSPGYLTKLGNDLLSILNINAEKIYFGISCPCCDNSAYYWYSTRLRTSSITFANLFVNCNYKRFITNFEKLKRDAIFIGNYRAENRPIGNLNILRYYLVNDDCISFWEHEAEKIIEQIKNDFGYRNDLLYVVSAGPMSEPIIMNLYKNNPNNCYIDFGSSIDKYIHQSQTRPYMDENSIYAKSNCWMYHPKTTNFDVSVVLSLYKRPENLDIQFKAFENQTLKPKEILLFKDGIEDGYKVEIPLGLKEQFNLVEVSENNCGVWERFRFAQRAKSKYVCVSDDDTIPGESWLENCHKNMLEQEGLYGTIGIILEKPEGYPQWGYFRVGWDGPLDTRIQVDFVGHSWFFKKEWLRFLFSGTQQLQKFKIVAEDISFSAQLQKQKINTFVPPHPENNIKLWGSLPNYAYSLGTSTAALSLSPLNHQKMNDAIRILLEKRWKILIQTNALYVNDVKNNLSVYFRNKKLNHPSSQSNLITLDKRHYESGKLFTRTAFYEFVQNLHLHNMTITLLFTSSVDSRILCDLSDLPRLKMYIRDNGSQIPAESIALFQDTGILNQLHTITDEGIRNVQGAWDAVVVTASDLALDTLEDFFITANFKLLLIADGLTSIETESRQKLTDFLKMTGFEAISDTPVAYHWKNKTVCGEYFFSQNRISEALKCFERALLDNPADEDALNNLGVVSYNFKNFPAAENFFIRAANLNRRNKNTLDNLIQNYMATEQFENAAGILKERIFMEPEQPDAYSLLGLCHDRLGHPNEAYDAYQNAKKLGGDAFPIPAHIVSDHDRYVATQNRNASKNTLRKILVINNLYPPQELGGYGRLLFDFTNILRKRGHSIYVLTSDTPYLGNTVGDAPDVDRSLELFGGWQGGVCKSIENREEIIRMIRKNLSKLQQVLNEFQPDVCLLGNIDFLSKNIMDPILEKKIPVVHHLGNQSPGYTVAETPKSRLYHLATASDWLKNVIKNDGYPLKDISVIYPGAMVEEFRMRIPPSYDKLRIAYASIVLPYKGPHILINALKKLNDLGIDFSCSMAGTTTDETFVNKLKEFITIQGMDNKIQFPGFLSREALKDLFARHNVLVFPSIVKEAFGISPVEAMAAGLTVITSGTGGAKEVVEHGVSGIIFKSEDDASLADALIGLAKDTRRWGQIALAGQRRAMELFDIEHSVDALESCFSRLLKSKRD